MKKVKELMERNLIKAQTYTLAVRNRLKEKRGDSNLASILFVTAVVIVVIVVIFFPQLRNMVTGAFTKADDKLNSVWNYT